MDDDEWAEAAVHALALLDKSRGGSEMDCRTRRLGMKEAAMHRPRNRQLQQGGTGTRAQRLRSGATRVHGGEHGSGHLGLNRRRTLATDEFWPHDVPIIRAQRPAVHFPVFAEKPTRLTLQAHSQEVAAIAIAVPNIAELTKASATGFG